MPVLVSFVVALVLHLTVGWAWSILGGVVGGWMAVRRGWVVGMLGVGLDWLVLVAYAHAVALGATTAMTHALGGILGNLPGAAIVAVTLLIGLLLGVLGGGIGTQLARLAGRTRVAAGRS